MVTPEEALTQVASVEHWHHQFEIVPGVTTPGSYDPRDLWDMLRLPESLLGDRVLDVGSSDGFFSLGLRRRGAEVVSVDYRPKDGHGFAVMEDLTGLQFDYRHTNVYEMSPGAFGTFNRVLFLGVLHHLPDMLRALSILRRLCTGTLYVETHCAVHLTPGVPTARYYRASTLANDFTNFWSPNPQCVRDMLYDAAFDVERSEIWGDRMLAECKVSSDPNRLRKLHTAYIAGL